MNKRNIFIIIFIAIILAVIIGFSIHKSGNQAPGQFEKEGTTQQNFPVVINNSQPLTDLLLTEQFVAIDSNLTDYVHNKYPKASSATIIDKPSADQDGNINFTLKIDGDTTQFPVKIKRLNKGMLEMIIAPNYDKTIDPYNNTPGGD